MRKILAISCFISILSGCMTVEPKVETTKSWENHYMNTKDFYNSTKDIQLEKGESIWVLSNSTLSRLLKNVKDK